MKRRTPASKKSNVIKVDFTGVNKTAHLDDGEYLGAIKSWEQKTSNNSGNEMVVFAVDIDGNELPYYCPLTPESLWKLRDLLECAGLEVPDGSMDIDMDELIDVEIGFIVENETYQGKKRPKINGTLPADQIGESEEPEEEPEEEEPEEKPAPTTRKRTRTAAAEPPPEDPSFEVGSKVSFEDDGKTVKGTIIAQAVDGKKKPIAETWVVKVGKDEWEIPEDELTLI